MAASVEKRTARARPFLSTDRLTTVTSTSSASWVNVMPRRSSISSRCRTIPCSETAVMSDGALDVLAQPDAVREDLGERQHDKASGHLREQQTVSVRPLVQVGHGRGEGVVDVLLGHVDERHQDE